ncbi:hypothetical protein G9444_3591 [Rhodococcus erythropolis]|uniref:Uncharacterized protein n=1 Tax=Rhodococcus erythropolis TaxID=1833 RepID=A0A6G9CUU8_RHOER|nr:hypothetical protein G9444_3591 [Rhodococcus erythropolis]
MIKEKATVELARIAPTPAATIPICSNNPNCSPKMFQYPRRKP